MNVRLTSWAVSPSTEESAVFRAGTERSQFGFVGFSWSKGLDFLPYSGVGNVFKAGELSGAVGDAAGRGPTKEEA
jgi:hypothetical protein